MKEGDTIDETWKPVAGYEAQYEVSSQGRVRSVEKSYYRGKPRVLKPRSNRGYLIVNLLDRCKRKTFYVHKLVAIAFCQRRDGCGEVNHVNGCKTDNSASNLEWVTRKQNVQHQFNVLGQRGPWYGKTGKDNASSMAVVIGGVWYASQACAAMELGVSQSTVSRALKRRGTLLGMEVYHE